MGFVVCALAAHALEPRPSPIDCKHCYEGASYDLTELAAQMPSQHSLDLQDSNDLDYQFSICNTVAPPTNCLKVNGESKSSKDWAPAWQTKSTQKPNPAKDAQDPDRGYLTCYRIGSPEKDDHTWDHHEDPSHGISLTYTNGQRCSNGDARQLTLNFKCAPTTPSLKLENHVLEEAGHCAYEIAIDTEYACPLECGLKTVGAVCSGHGICGYDRDAGKARCYCNTGRSGEHCTDAHHDSSDEGHDSNYGPVLGLLIFVTIVVIVVLGMLVALWRFMQTRKVEVMGDVYTSLHGGGADTFEIDRVDMSQPDRRDSFTLPNTERPVFSAEERPRDTKLE